MIRRLLLTAIVSGTLFGAVGCRHRCCSSGCTPTPYLPAGPGAAGGIPPAGLPATPGSTVFPPADLGTLPPAAPPRAAPSLGGPPQPEVLTPDPIPGVGPRGQVTPGANPLLGAPIQLSGGQTSVSSSPDRPVATPVGGLAGYTKVKDGVASGRKPALDGFDALKRLGYRTVVYLHAPGADLSATKLVTEQRGLTFVAILTTPDTLPAALESFNKVVGDRSAAPVYVADDTGIRAGALWYLHFLTADLQSAEVAKIRARSLGLTEDGEDAKSLWVAVQQHLANRDAPHGQD